MSDTPNKPIVVTKQVYVVEWQILGSTEIVADSEESAEIEFMKRNYHKLVDDGPECVEILSGPKLKGEAE